LHLPERSIDRTVLSENVIGATRAGPDRGMERVRVMPGVEAGAQLGIAGRFGEAHEPVRSIGIRAFAIGFGPVDHRFS
jgi:hypothetical protein